MATTDATIDGITLNNSSQDPIREEVIRRLQVPSSRIVGVSKTQQAKLTREYDIREQTAVFKKNDAVLERKISNPVQQNIVKRTNESAVTDERTTIDPYQQHSGTGRNFDVPQNQPQTGKSVGKAVSPLSSQINNQVMGNRPVHAASQYKPQSAAAPPPSVPAQNHPASLPNSLDPRQALISIIDQDGKKREKVGEEIGTVLFIIWSLIAVITSILGLGIFGIPGMLVMNLLLIWPKGVYKISEIILDFFGIGEALQAADELGLDTVAITVAGWQKGVIIAIDFAYVFVLLSLLVVILSAVCYLSNGGGITAQIVGKAADLASGSQWFSQFNAICKQLR